MTHTGDQTPSHAAFRARRRFGSLDGLRGLAILGVAWHHSPVYGGVAGWPATGRGYLGVDLFFVLSGFLITTLLLRERDERGSIATWRFLGRRALRLFPLYYTVLAATAVVFLFVAPGAEQASLVRAHLPYCATYTSNWVYIPSLLILTWSLAAEEQFYVTWAPLLRWLGYGAAWCAVAVMAVGVAVAFGALDPWLEGILGPRFRDLNMVQSTFNPIALGCLTGFLLHRPGGYTWARRFLGTRAAAPAAALVLFLAADVTAPDPLRAPRPLVHLAMTLLVAACVVREDHGLARCLRWRPLARLGVVSYGVYLLHIFTFQGARRLPEWTGFVTPPGVYVINVLAAWGVAELSYRFLETPFLRLKERLR